jgi:hypothetical protein
MSGYTDTAFSYDESDLGLDPETKLRFKPNKKELELFKLEKLNMYKGTWMVCFVYGITAIILLSVIFFTEWGRTYIYDKFFPAVITYVLGAIVIIIYLIVSIFSIVPRKLRKSVETLPVCPDYWKLQETDPNMKTNMKANITDYRRAVKDKPSGEDTEGKYIKGKNDQYILDKPGEDINISSNDHVLDYKCVPDNNVYGDINNLKSQLELINENNNRYHKGTTFEDYKANEEQPKYIYVDSSNIYSPELASSLSLQNYAQITGVYKNSWTTPGAGPEAYYDNTIVKYDDAGTKISYQGNFVDPKIHVGINTKPLICNELYPYLLDSMENKEKNQELKCEYAKKCGVSWSYLDCYGDKGVLSSIPLSVKPVTTTTPAA